MITRVCAVLLHAAQLGLLSWNRKIPITHIHFRHCHESVSSLVRHPFSKQLYTNEPLGKLRMEKIDMDYMDFNPFDNKMSAWKKPN